MAGLGSELWPMGPNANANPIGTVDAYSRPSKGSVHLQNAKRISGKIQRMHCNLQKRE
jgi:hypothetical protein